MTGVEGRRDGPLRDTGFDISAASEIIAIVALAADYDDLRRRLSLIVLGWTDGYTPVRAAQLGCVGAMMVLLKDALKPNLVQTAEGQSAIVHSGPLGVRAVGERHHQVVDHTGAAGASLRRLDRGENGGQAGCRTTSATAPYACYTRSASNWRARRPGPGASAP